MIGIADQPRVVREKTEVVVRITRSDHLRFTDLLDYGDAVIRVNEFVADLETNS